MEEWNVITTDGDCTPVSPTMSSETINTEIYRETPSPEVHESVTVSHKRKRKGAETSRWGYCAATVLYGPEYCQHLDCKYKHPESPEEYSAAVAIVNSVMQTNPFCLEKTCMNLVSNSTHLYCCSCAKLHPRHDPNPDYAVHDLLDRVRHHLYLPGRILQFPLASS